MMNWYILIRFHCGAYSLTTGVCESVDLSVERVEHTTDATDYVAVESKLDII
jgi:hypothetical protein